MWGSVSLLVATDTIYMNKGIDPGLRLQSPLLYPVFCHELSLHLKYRRLEVRCETWGGRLTHTETRPRRGRCTNLSLLGIGRLAGGLLSCLSIVRSLLPVVLRPSCAVVLLASRCGCWTSSSSSCCCCSWSCSCCTGYRAACLGWETETDMKN